MGKVRRSYVRHGIAATYGQYRDPNTPTLDQRSAPARAMVARRAKMVAELGGEGKITEEQRMLVNTAVSTELLRDNVIVRLLDQTIQGTERRAWEREHRRLDDALTRTLKILAKTRSRARLRYRRSGTCPA